MIPSQLRTDMPSAGVTVAGGTGITGAVVAAALQFFAASQSLIRENWPPEASVTNSSSWDFVVVGGGTAGAALAARLAEQHASVLLLEAGGDPPQESIIPVFGGYLKDSPYDWSFKGENNGWSSQALSGGRQRQPRGKMLGGSGSMNDMVYARGFPADYHEWAKLVGEQWNWTTVLEYFKKTEHLTDERIINDPELMKYHGRHGEIEVAGLNESTYTTDKFLEAFEELGFQIVKDMTYPELIGAGRFSHTIRGGQRDSTLTAMLNKQGQRENLKVVKNATVTKILINNNTAHGVEVLKGGDRFTYFANKEVIVTAGTFNTAKLLMLSGIGPKEHLQGLGIEVIKDLPVGENLDDHVMVLTFLSADNGTCHAGEAEGHMAMMRYLYDRTGLYSRTNSMGAYIAGNKDKSVPEFAIYPNCVPARSQFYDGCLITGLRDEFCTKLNSVLKDRELLIFAVVQLKPQSRGRVRLRSADPAADPLIYSGSFSNISDLDAFPAAMKVARSVGTTSYFRSLNARFVSPDIAECGDLVGEEAVKCEVRAMAMSAWHSVGTAAMGSVVDGELRVRGVRALRVADASVMPRVVRGNTNAPVVMIAERAADFIKKEHFCATDLRDPFSLLISV